MSSLALFSPMSLRAGGDAVGFSPRFARLGLVPLLRNGMCCPFRGLFLSAMRYLRSMGAAVVSDEAA
jgi:hypothetical protein